MALSPEEQQQLDEIKGWWKKNGPSIMLGAGLAVAVVGGYKGWDFWQENQAQTAATLYRHHGEFLEQGQRVEAGETLARLQNDYSSTFYAVMASLISARQHLEAGERDDAVAALQWAKDHAKDPAFTSMAALRLARLHIAAVEWEQGLALLDNTEIDTAFAGVAHEIRGDLYRLAGRVDEARHEYALALENGQEHDYLKLKISDLGEEESLQEESPREEASAGAESGLAN